MSLSIIDPSCANSSRVAAWRPAAITLLVGSDVTSVAVAADAPRTALQAGPVAVTFGGFITALESVYRDHNETADIGSNSNTAIPFPYQPNEQISEFRENARQSRLSVLAQGPHTGAMGAEGYPPPNNRKSQ